MFEETYYMFVTDMGMIACESYEDDGDFIRVIKPLKLQPQKDGQVAFLPLFFKEEWARLNKSHIQAELSMLDEISRGYKSAKTQIFSGLVLANNSLI